MIQVDIYYNDQDKISGYRVSGHADSNPEGFDQVCALVSLDTQLPVLGMERVLRHKVQCAVDEADGTLEVRLEDAPNEQTEVLLKTMVCGLQELKRYYPQCLTTEEHRR